MIMVATDTPRTRAAVVIGSLIALLVVSMGVAVTYLSRAAPDRVRSRRMTDEQMRLRFAAYWRYRTMSKSM
jgi:hypothetical protein